MNEIKSTSLGKAFSPSGYDAAAIARYFDSFGAHEWERLIQSPSDEVSLYIHTNYLEKHIVKGQQVLEIGGGAGRFTQVLARLGAQILVGDLSNVQLELNKRFASELGFDEAVLDRQQLDICDLSRFEPESFDCVVAYGGPLSYVLDGRDLALSECLRVLRSGGLLLLSVMSLWGRAHAHLDGVLSISISANQKITNTGDISPATFPERKTSFMHLFRADELMNWLKGRNIELIDFSASNCLSLTWNEELKEIKQDVVKWRELLRMELEACAEAGCLNMGTHLIAVVRKA